jgi:hypothetical protein
MVPDSDAAKILRTMADRKVARCFPVYEDRSSRCRETPFLAFQVQAFCFWREVQFALPRVHAQTMR